MHDAPQVRVRCTTEARSEMNTSVIIDSGMTVDAVLLAWPESAQVFNALGVDACCGGHASLDEAAADAHVELVRLLAALRSVAHLSQPVVTRENAP